MKVSFSPAGIRSLNVFEIPAQEAIDVISSHDQKHEFVSGHDQCVGMYMKTKERSELLVICRNNPEIVIEVALPVTKRANEKTVRPRPVAVLASIAKQFGKPFLFKKSTSLFLVETKIDSEETFEVRSVVGETTTLLSDVDSNYIFLNISDQKTTESKAQALIGLACCIDGSRYKVWFANCKKCLQCFTAIPDQGNRMSTARIGPMIAWRWSSSRVAEISGVVDEGAWGWERDRLVKLTNILQK